MYMYVSEIPLGFTDNVMRSNQSRFSWYANTVPVCCPHTWFLKHFKSISPNTPGTHHLSDTTTIMLVL